MNKKQVGALLKVMGKGNMRPALNVGYVDKYNDRVVLVATDGYKLAAVYMDGADELIGKNIRREAIERWYKLATGKDRLNGEELVRVSSEDYSMHGEYQDTEFPEWQRLMPTHEPEPQEAMRFNADFFKVVQDLDGSEGVKVELYGRLAPMVVKGDIGTYMVMPLK